MRIAHTLTFTKPTSMGKSSEETDGATVLHVGKFGALSLAQLVRGALTGSDVQVLVGSYSLNG